uniref:BTB domain-containing protein n=1 Tax=Mycena chlorophos TaxID=658473 RepID=A0ABQ0LFY2_MYCCL|nr:predicted protein [Mycena chlorophos]
MSDWDVDSSDSDSVIRPRKVTFAKVASVRLIAEPTQYQTTPPSCRVLGCSLPVDIVLRSSDGVSFGAHANNLAQSATGLPPAEREVRQQSNDEDETEIVQLVESADVLELLLQYTHYQRQPSSKGWCFPLLERLAEAVEKYRLFGAMEVCKLRMEANARIYSQEVLSYAVKHDYPDIRDVIMPQTLSWDLEDIQSTLGDSFLIIAWVKYREQYLKLSTSFPSIDAESSLHTVPRCENGPGWELVEAYVKQATRYPDCLRELPDFQKTFSRKVFLLSRCPKCRDRVHNWEQKINDRYATIKQFASFV